MLVWVSVPDVTNNPGPVFDLITVAAAKSLRVLDANQHGTWLHSLVLWHNGQRAIRVDSPYTEVDERHVALIGAIRALHRGALCIHKCVGGRRLWLWSVVADACYQEAARTEGSPAS